MRRRRQRLVQQRQYRLRADIRVPPKPTRCKTSCKIKTHLVAPRELGAYVLLAPSVSIFERLWANTVFLRTSSARNVSRFLLIRLKLFSTGPPETEEKL